MLRSHRLWWACVKHTKSKTTNRTLRVVLMAVKSYFLAFMYVPLTGTSIGIAFGDYGRIAHLYAECSKTNKSNIFSLRVVI